MTSKEVQNIIQNIPIGYKLQIIKSNGDIVEVTLAENEVTSIVEKDYGSLKVPSMPPSITVQGKRWGTYRMEIDDIVDIARVG